MSSREPSGIDQYLTESRRGLDRMTPRDAYAAKTAGWLLVDIRTDPQRRAQGRLPRAAEIDLTVLEWRLDPASESRISAATSFELPVIVICRQGYSSSLAAARLRAIGLHRATDVIDGVEGWQRDGLPVIGGCDSAGEPTMDVVDPFGTTSGVEVLQQRQRHSPSGAQSVTRLRHGERRGQRPQPLHGTVDDVG